jgi:GNAT superfamily N-acetyltransferase
VKALVVYESMYGNTHAIAEAIASGLRHAADAEVMTVHDADAGRVNAVDLLVVGGPTHVHGMTRESSRKAALDAAAEPDSGLAVDPDAEGEGVREWLESLRPLGVRAAAFDTRVGIPPALSGRASKGIAKKLRERGCELIVDPESFLVTKDNHLEPDEEAHARRWGAELAAALVERASELT